MPRKLYIHAAGAVYHMILRGNTRQEIFSDDRDRFRFLQYSPEILRAIPVAGNPEGMQVTYASY
jgi:hypothetical protein